MIDNQKFKSKIEKEYPNFVEGLEGLSKEDLEKNLLIYAKHREQTEYAKRNDDELNELKEQVKELQAPYNDTLKALKAKMGYLNVLLMESLSEGSEE